MLSALIMEGGAMRGMFTCGVIDVLLRNGITFDAACGISAGAVFGCNYKSGQIGRALRYNKRFCRDPRYCSLRSLLRTGDLYGADFCYRELPETLDPFDKQAYRDNPLRFFVGATDAETGRCVIRECSDGGDTDMLWLRASASMPMVSRPVIIDGHPMLDGGIADPVPYAWMEEQGCRRNVLVLTQPAGYRKKPVKGIPMVRLMLRRYPAAAEAIVHRHEVYNRQMEEIDSRERTGESLVIRPPHALGIGHTEKDPAELERVYRIGVREAEKRLGAIRSFLYSDT